MSSDNVLGSSPEKVSNPIRRVELRSGKFLDVFENPRKDIRGYLVEWTSGELTSLCPVTGHPDFCTLTVAYVPDEWCLELKSAKLYLEAFRNEGHFYEELINQVYEDIGESLEPMDLRVMGEFNVRGGIGEVITIGEIGDARLVVER